MRHNKFLFYFCLKSVLHKKEYLLREREGGGLMGDWDRWMMINASIL